MTPEEIEKTKGLAYGLVQVIKKLLIQGKPEDAQRVLVVLDGKLKELIEAGAKIGVELQTGFTEVSKGIIALGEQQCIAKINAEVEAAQQRVTDASDKAEIAADAQKQIDIVKAASAKAQAEMDDDGGGDGAAPVPQAAGAGPQEQMADVALRPVAVELQQRDYDAYQQQNASDDQQGYVALGGDEKSVCPCVIL